MTRLFHNRPSQAMEQLILCLRLTRMNRSAALSQAKNEKEFHSIGLYHLVAYAVSQRTQEIGNRMALGAQRGNVLKMILAQGVRLIIPGAVIGIACGTGAAYLMRSMLFGVTAWDPAIFVLVTVLLTAVTLAASFVPARQATKVDPLVALRYE